MNTIRLILVAIACNATMLASAIGQTTSSSSAATENTSANAALNFPQNELSVNLFRSPSIGLEYRRDMFSIHAGYYPTNFETNVTTEFFRAGVTFWFLPIATGGIVPSSFYSSLSYLYGFTREYQGDSGAMLEVGFRWMPWSGLNVRIGVDVFVSPNHTFKVNPNPGVSWSFIF